MPVTLSRQTGFVGVSPTDRLVITRQAAYVGVSNTDRLSISRQTVFIGISPSGAPPWAPRTTIC